MIKLQIHYRLCLMSINFFFVSKSCVKKTMDHFAERESCEEVEFLQTGKHCVIYMLNTTLVKLFTKYFNNFYKFTKHSTYLETKTAISTATILVFITAATYRFSQIFALIINNYYN